MEDTAYTDSVTLTVLLPEGGTERFADALRELSAGKLQPVILGEVEKSAPK